ncbi:MAG: DNA translocase FtsK 4TM domain-containing protein [Candidatus Saccharibacteria bacterium]|nr:DNA translocase FtsK 4TM domain-containing protein [Candidatus Saccharibacteria bacterium]
MAKRKKRSNKKQSHKKMDVPREPNMFVRQMASVFMIIVAIFLLLGGFGTGGNLPVGMFELVYKVLGVAAYLSPVALVYWAIHKFKSEDHNLSPSKVLSMSSLLISFSSWLHVAFVTRPSETADYIDGKGGGLGELIGGTVLGAFDKLPASICFFPLVVLLKVS